MPKEKKVSRATPAYFESYAEYNRILRSWFVAFGAGGLALFLVEDPLRAALIASGQARTVMLLFLAGAAAQVTVAFLNKYASWYAYAGENDAAFRKSRRYRFWSWLTRQFWIDISLDILAGISFMTAIWILFDVFARQA